MAVSNGMTGPTPLPVRSTFFCLAAITVSALLLLQVVGAGANLSLFYLFRQDQWLLLVGTALMGLSLWHLGPRERPLSGTWRLALLAGSVMAVAAFAGHYTVLLGYDMSRDEQLATFDAAIFAQGSLLAPLPAFWCDHADALNTMFMYPAEQRGGWVSAYLPLNAALRSLFGIVATPVLTGPLMILTGALALWGCARRIWPQDREAALVALLLYLGSAQILVNGMTAYAMPAHLALNLCWLWLFLGRRWWMDGLALVIGFVAVGLHQPHMHPLFVGPILFLLLLERSWWRAAAYLVGYAAIGAFWLWWPAAIWALSQASELAPRPEGVDYSTRLLVELKKGDAMAFANMVANLLRFAAWQHLLLIPLLFVGVQMARRDRLAGALAAGVLLTIVVMAVILPYQGHGFGYRYLHGVIGSCILLAVYGWIALVSDKGAWRTLLLRTSVAGVVILMPIQVWMAHEFYAPFARVSARLDASAVDYVVVGEGDTPFSADLVINPPFLDRRPVRLLRDAIDPESAAALCANRPTVALAGNRTLNPINIYFHSNSPPAALRANQAIAVVLAAAGCRVKYLG